MISSTALKLSTDASLHIGLGGVFGSHWFSVRWPPHLVHLDIAPKELFAILVTVSVWKEELSNKQIVLFTDNEACVQVWVSRASPDPGMLRFLRPLFFTCAAANINLFLQHIPGIDNT